MLDRPRQRASRQIILIIIAAAALYLIGNNSVSLWDRDEPRYAQTSKQMLESGDWVVPRLLDQVRTAKPIFIYWCQAAAMKLFGASAFSARLPSAVGMTLTLILLGVVLFRSVGPQRALWTVMVMATAGLCIGAAKMCLTDAVLLVFITTAQLCLCTIYIRYRGPALSTSTSLSAGRRERGRDAWLVLTMWIAIAFAILTKGPVVFGVQLMTMLVLLISDWKSIRWNWWTRLSPFAGIFIILLICGPWAYFIHQREPNFFSTIIGHDVVNRMISPLEGHKGPPGYYILTIWGTFFPWSLLLPATIVSAWKHRQIPHIRFALAALIGPWIMFEIVQTKLPHYLLPTFPALAFLTADMLIRAARHRHFADRAFLRVVIAWGAIVVLIGLSPWLAVAGFGMPPRVALFALVLLPILAFEYARSVYVHFRAGRPLGAAAAMGIGMIVIIAILFGVYFPNVPFLRISTRVADVLKQEGAMRAGDAIMIDYKENSLAFYQGGTIRPQRDNRFLENVPPIEWPRWIVVSGAVWKKMPQSIQNQLEIIDTIHGLNYAGSDEDKQHVIDVLVLRRK